MTRFLMHVHNSDVSCWLNPRPCNESLAVVRLRRRKQHATIGQAMASIDVGLHPEDPATGQLNQGFQWFSLVQEQMLSW
jgi:hypothetical protein